MQQNQLTRLRRVLLSYYDSPAAIRVVAEDAGLPVSKINFNAPPDLIWADVLREANRIKDGIEKLSQITREEYPSIPHIEIEDRPSIPDIVNLPWHSDIPAGELEKVMGKQATFLPISFLELGAVKARAVVRVVCPGGYGSGFLINGNWLLTNHHVLPNKSTASASCIQCNYQETANGLAAPVSEFVLNPEAGFATSPYPNGNDWTAVRVHGEANAEWGALHFSDTPISINDFVNIIQHPDGGPKQIALYHNIVTFADDLRVQYLTDTRPGSSGSPVFDSRWRVVALHHSGGLVREPGTNQILFRNEGIAVSALKCDLHAHGILP